MATSSTTKETSARITTTTVGTKVSAARDHAFYTGQLKPLLEKQYGLAIINTNNATGAVSFGNLNLRGLNPAEPGGSPEYFFSIAPKVQELSEPFATTIVPTQRGGKFVESHGSILKNIRLQGTTGIRPRRTTEFAALPLIGSTLDALSTQFDVFRTDVERNVPVSERTGFDDIIFLRNLFRAYSDLKENNEASNNFVMIWRNDKDSDSWIVEPKEFKIMRSATSPLTYEYSITLTTLAPHSTIFVVPEDPLEGVLGVRKVFSRVQEFNQSLRRTFLIVSNQINRLEGLGVFAQTSLLDPIINVTRGLGVIRATGATFGVRLRHNAQVLFDELDEAIALLTGTPGVEQQDSLVRSLRRAQITAAKILAEPGTRESVDSEGSERKERYSQAYVKGGDTLTSARVGPAVGSSKSYIGNSPITDRVSQDFVHAGEDVRAIAGRLLGDRSQWHTIVTLNGLRSPYISADGRADTLSVGDPVLYPATSRGVGSATLNPVNISDSETQGTDVNTLGPVQQAYGRDFRLRSVPVSASGVDLTDFTINQRGDFSTIVGIPNVSQAVTVKFSTEKGELPAHPTFGASFPIGGKATPSSVNDFALTTESTILSDTRVDNIKELNFVTVRDTLFVTATLLLTDGADTLDTTVALRRL